MVFKGNVRLPKAVVTIAKVIDWAFILCMSHWKINVTKRPNGSSLAW